MNKVRKIESSAKNPSLVFLFGVPITTLFFAVNLNDPFNVPKLILILIISSWLAVNLILDFKNSPIAIKSGESYILILLALFLIFQLLSALYNSSSIISFFGDTQRRNGFLTYLGLVIIFIYAARLIKHFDPIIIFKMLLYTSSIVIIYSLIQIQGKDFVQWQNPYNAAISTFGNPNFTSAFMALVCVMGLGSSRIKTVSPFFKILAITVSFLSVFVILKSQSRQGIYAIIVAILFYINMQFHLNRSKYRFVILSSSVLMLLFSIFGMLQRGPFVSYLYKDSVSVRGFYWRAAIDMFLDHPIVGVGLDQYGMFFRQYKEIEYVQRYGSDLTSTNAHNTFLQLFATGGFFVGLFYLLVILSVYFYGYKHMSKCENNELKKIMLIMLSTYTAFQAQSVISIDNIGLAIWNWCLGGAIVGFAMQIKKASTGTKSPVAKLNFNFQLLKPIFHFIFLIPTLIISILLYRSESESFLLRGIANPNFPANKIAVVEYANKILNNPIADPYLKTKSALYLGDMGAISEGYLSLSKLSNKYPKNYEILWSLSIFQDRAGDTDLAIATRTRIIALDPFNTKNYLLLAQLFKLKNDQFMMQKMKSKILEIDNNSQDAKDVIALIG